MDINRLDWDSGFFGLRIGKVCINSEEECLALAERRASVQNDFDLVYVFASHGLGVKLPKARLVDEKVVYKLSDTFYSESNHNVILWDSDKGVTDDLLHLALVSGKYSRFYTEEGLPVGSYERLYSRWIEQSVNRVLATKVFCYLEDGVPRGLVTLDEKDNHGSIGLVAILEDFQSRGIGTAMIKHVIGQMHVAHRQKLFVATQAANIPACRLYEKCGFQVDSVTDIWHWWL